MSIDLLSARTEETVSEQRKLMMPAGPRLTSTLQRSSS